MNRLSPLKLGRVAATVVTVNVLEVGDLWREGGRNLRWPEGLFGCGGCCGSGSDG